MRAVLVTPLAKTIPVFPDAVYVGVDAGAARILEAGLPLSHALGDFDTGAAPAGVPVARYPVEKDQSDLELAIAWAEENGYVPVVAGGLGGRTDHMVANLLLLANRYHNVVFWSPDEQVLCLQPGRHEIAPAWKNVSFFACVPSVLSLSGFKYPLDRYTLVPGDVLCLSNQVTGASGTVNLESGRLVCVMTDR